MRSSMVRYSCAAARASGFGAHTFAEKVERRRDLARVERLDGSERRVERLAGDEACRELLGESVAPNELENARLIGKVEKALSKH